MERHFQRELESLKTTLIKMGSVAEDNVIRALRAITERNIELAREVVEMDQRVDDLEVEIDHAIIDLLALQQPVASDLRFIIAAQKINNDLERIGDHAVNIAQSTEQFAATPSIDMLDIPEMAEIAKKMLRDALDSFIRLDPAHAGSILNIDDRIDVLDREMGNKVVQLIKTNERTLECGMELIQVSRNLERIADLATNIAEEVIFQAHARIVKHHADEKK
jgi:phosphate transport system protein